MLFTAWQFDCSCSCSTILYIYIDGPPCASSAPGTAGLFPGCLGPADRVSSEEYAFHKRQLISMWFHEEPEVETDHRGDGVTGISSQKKNLSMKTLKIGLL